jgi:hypothetical protein
VQHKKKENDEWGENWKRMAENQSFKILTVYKFKIFR